jgi:hypothetical protein
VKTKKHAARPSPNPYDQSDCPFEAATTVPESGIYQICHYDEPRATVILLTRGIFPLCRKCGDKVRYKLLKAVPHISEDPDFREPFTEPQNRQEDRTTPSHDFPQQLGQAYGFRFEQDDMQAWRESRETGDLPSHP